MSLDRSPKYLFFLFLFMVINDIFDTYTTQLPNTIGSFVKADFLISDSTFSFVIAIASIGMYFVFINQFLADFIGRKKMLFTVLFGMGFASFLLGISPDLVCFTLSLFILYIFFSSDVWVLIMNEESPDNKRGFFTSLVLVFGVIGALFIIIFRETLIVSLGWRAMTWFALLAMPLAFLTFLFKESCKYEECRQKALESTRSLKTKIIKIFQHENRAAFIVIFLTSLILGLSYVLFALGEPYFADTKHFSVTEVNFLILMMGAGAIFGYLITAFILDKLGRKPTIYLYILLIFISVVLIIFGDYLIDLICVTIFSAFFWGLFVALRIVSIELFSTDIRGVGTGFRSLFFAFGFTIGSLFSGFLSPFIGLGGVFLSLSAISLLIIPLIYKFVAETKGIELALV
ncbi:MAG: MFS transporter [Candidatus Helarchaeota archaeon]